MAAFNDDKKAVGSAFRDAPHPTSTPAINHPLDDVDPSAVSSSEPSLHVLTPRPQRFSSLEEAYSQITSRSRDGSRQVSGETRNSGSGDESFLMSLSPTDAQALYTNIGFPVTHAFGRSLSETGPTHLPHFQGDRQLHDGDPKNARDLASQLPSRTEPVIRPNLPRRYMEARNFAETDTSNQPPLYSSTDHVDHIVNQDGPPALASSAVHSHADVYEFSVDIDYSVGQYDNGAGSNIGSFRVAEDVPCPPPSFNCTMATGLGAHSAQAPSRSKTEPSSDWEAKRLNFERFNRIGATENQTVPDMPLPKDPPFHPSNPFATAVTNHRTMEPAPGINTSPRSHSSCSPRPLLHYSDSEGDDTHIGSDLGVGSEADNRLSVLQPPPERMHSARKHDQGQRSTASTVQASVSGTTTGESDNDDPFKYDGLFPQRSKEREVSVYLHQVSGMAQYDGAVHYSPEKTTSKGTGQYLNGEAISPAGKRSLSNARSTNMTPVKVFDHNARAQEHSSGHGFFESKAIDPEWALGSPDAVRVPVRHMNLRDQVASLEDCLGDQEDAQQLGMETLRCGEGQNRRLTGNTED